MIKRLNEKFRYALAVFENEHLSELWDIENANFSISNGQVLFQNNPRLCYYKIENFVKSLGMNESLNSETDISPYSNGDKEICKCKWNCVVRPIYKSLEQFMH